MNENTKINLIYFWEKNKGFFEKLLEVILFPIWFPLLLLCLPFMLIDEEIYEEDVRWCKEHGMEYPNSEYMYDGHSVVRKWKKERKREKREKDKEIIRKRLQLEEKIKEENNK